MSQKKKRIVKKFKALSENYKREAEIDKLIELYSAVLKTLNDELDDLWKDYENKVSYIYNNDANITYDVLELPNGEIINVMVLESNDEIVVAHNGIIRKAKKHDHDEFNFEIGYNIAATRLIMKLLQKKYEF
jgi:effector-binding domain-containing protein